MDDNRFLGRGWSFPPSFNSYDQTVVMSEYEQDIKESLNILLSTAPGERIMQPGYGCGLKHLVFESISESLMTQIRDMVERAILFFETRIDVEKVSITNGSDTMDIHQSYDGVLKINVDYRIRQTNSRSNIVYPFYFTEGSNIKGHQA